MLPECEVASPLMGINEELFTWPTRPKLIRKFQEYLGVDHHITFLNGLCFPPRQGWPEGDEVALKNANAN